MAVLATFNTNREQRSKESQTRNLMSGFIGCTFRFLIFDEKVTLTSGAPAQGRTRNGISKTA
eukprot:4001989-Amphidinium_carterae.1